MNRLFFRTSRRCSFAVFLLMWVHEAIAQSPRIMLVTAPGSHPEEVKFRFKNFEAYPLKCSLILVNVVYEVNGRDYDSFLEFYEELLPAREMSILHDKTQEAQDWVFGQLNEQQYLVKSLKLNQEFTECEKVEERPTCPLGFISIPGDPTPNLGGINNPSGIAPFCLAKYEMKHPSDASGCASRRCADTDSAVPVSRPEHKPWTYIKRNEARAACGRMNNGSNSGFQFSLVSNGQWQAVARDIERTAGNWSGGTVGSVGGIPRGHSDGDPSASLAASHDGDVYAGTGNHADGGWEQRRTHALSNGEVLWDLSGNVWEWVNDDVASLGVDMSNVSSQELINLSPHIKALFGPVGKYGRERNFGFFATYGFSAVVRGGNWGSGDYAGVFDTYAGLDPIDVYGYEGFRCAAYPAR